MKTTIEIPDDVFRRSKAAAALRGESLKEYVTASLRARLRSEGEAESAESGWRRVFGRAQADQIAEVDAILDEEFTTVDPDSWR